jgi:hypothetical protein
MRCAIAAIAVDRPNEFVVVHAWLQAGSSEESVWTANGSDLPADFG